jgi:hypothetical protein
MEWWAHHKKHCLTTTGRLFQLWVLADKLSIPKVQNLVIEQTVAFSRLSEGFQILQLQYVYQNTKEDCALRRLLIQLVAWSLTARHDFYRISKSLFPSEFMVDVAMLYSNAAPQRKTRRRLLSKIDAADFYESI